MNAANNPVASKEHQVRRGVKEVVKFIRKGEKGYVSLTHHHQSHLLSILSFQNVHHGW
jgi:ribosomal protein L7Ae-like RNA K-turn-binding protein